MKTERAGPCVQNDKFRGSNLQNHFEYWEQITSNQKILSWIRDGVDIPFKDIPEPFHFKNRLFKDKEAKFIRQELRTLAEAGCISRCDSKPLFISPINVVPES